MINYVEDTMLSKFINERNEFNEFLGKKSLIKIGSLGPKGTTTYNATEYLVKYLEELQTDKKVEIYLWNNFKDIQEALVNREIDIIIIPNPFENITEIYWDHKLELVFYFVLESPSYGLALEVESNLDKKHIKIATGPAVNHLIHSLGTDILKDHTHELYYVNSTTEAAIAVKEGKADLAMTNEISANKTGLKFITEKLNAKILWSVFKNKK